MRKLPQEIRSEINRRAHHAAAMFGEQIRRKLVAEAERIIDSGGNIERVMTGLERLEAKINRGSDD